VAGVQGAWKDSGDGGSALKALFGLPCDITITPGGEILVVDWYSDRIRIITPDGLIHAFVGSGNDGDGVSGPGISTDIFRPGDIKLGPDLSWYVGVLQNEKIKRFTGPLLECSIFAGTTGGYGGDGGLANQARLSRPSRMVFDDEGNLFFVDEGNSRIRRIDEQAGVITTLAGGTRGDADGIGDSAQFSFRGDWSIQGGSPPGSGIDISPDGEYLFVSDCENHKIRRIDIATRLVTTFAGSGVRGYSGDGGSALTAELSYPIDLAMSGSGDLYVADSYNHVIRKINPAGIITTVAGTGLAGFSPDSTRATEGMLDSPHGIAFHDASNTLYIADSYNQQIKKVISP